MDWFLKKALEAYKNYDSERTPCRVCYTSSARMTPIFPFEEEGIQLLHYVLLYELTSEEKSVFICEDCLEAIHRCVKNINHMRSRHYILPTLGGRHCWTCQTASCLTLRRLPENSTKQIIFHRLKGLLVLGQSMWICNACEEVVDDLEELLRSVHKTEILMLEGSTIEETPVEQNYESISKPFGDSHSKSRLSFMQSSMQAVLNIQPTETTTVTPPTVTYDDPIQELLALCATVNYDAIVSTGSLEKRANESLNAENATSSNTYDPVPNLKDTPTVRRKLFDSPEKVFVYYYDKEYSDITTFPGETGGSNLTDSEKEVTTAYSKTPELILPEPSEPCLFSFLDVDDIQDELDDAISKEDLESSDVPFSVLVEKLELMEKAQKEDPQMSDFQGGGPIKERDDYEERNNYQEKMPREDWGILLNENYGLPTYVRANDQRNKQDNKHKVSKLEKPIIDPGSCIPPSAGRISADSNEEPTNSFCADPASVSRDPFMDADFIFRLFCDINIHDSPSEEKQSSTEASQQKK